MWTKRWTKYTIVTWPKQGTITKAVNVHEAKTQFSKLLKRVERGEEVVIARAGRPVARICPLATSMRPNRTPGTGKGFFAHIDQLLAPLPDEIQRFFEPE